MLDNAVTEQPRANNSASKGRPSFTPEVRHQRENPMRHATPVNRLLEERDQAATENLRKAFGEQPKPDDVARMIQEQKILEQGGPIQPNQEHDSEALLKELFSKMGEQGQGTPPKVAVVPEASKDVSQDTPKEIKKPENLTELLSSMWESVKKYFVSIFR